MTLHVPVPPSPQPPRDPFRVFYAITGLGFIAFASGFAVCLSGVDSIEACVDHADSMVSVMKAAGDKIIAWCIALFGEVFSRYPVGG